METFNLHIPFGVNRLVLNSVLTHNDKTELFIAGFKKAKRVVINGSFSEKIQMSKTELGWSATLQLTPGRYFYKLSVDGKESPDENNLLKVRHPELGLVSVIFITNYTFELSDYAQASKIYVAGNFNGWKVGELEMKRNDDLWQLPIYLPDGTFAYKFIVDGNWITDPDNPVIRPDGEGNFNSYLNIGSVSVFRLYGNLDAREVKLAGNFNLWNYAELQMLRTPSGWEIHYALAPGIYEYKFVVDDEWIPDPNNPFRIERNEGFNSLICIKPNYTFILEKFDEAIEVIVTGTFTDWARRNFKMHQEKGVWTFPIYLLPGRHLYHFIVDGEIVTDPNNPQTDDSEFGQTSSVLAI